MTIDKGLSFRVEATPHEGIGSKGLSVKVKVRKKQDAGTQYDTILKIKKAGSRDKTIHLVQSEQTMTSFDMLLEKQNAAVKKRGSFFRNFKPGGCLDPPLDEDRHKYIPKAATPKSSATPKTSQSSSSLNSKKTCKYKKHSAQCVELKKEENEHPIEKSSSASVMSLFKDVPTASLNAHSSNTIITYPTHAKRSRVSTSSSKKSIDEKRKKSFSQTTELYFKPKAEETGAKSPSKVSKVKNISREGHRSVDSDMLPYIQEAAKAQMSYIQDDLIFNKRISQPVLLSDVKTREDDAIIADFENNRKNVMLSGRAAILSDADIKPLKDNTITSEKADHIEIASAAGLTVAGLAAAGLTAAAIKQPQDEKTSDETVVAGVDSKKGEEPLPSLKDDKLEPETPLTDSKSGIPKLKSHVISKEDDAKDHISNQSQKMKSLEKITSDSANAAKFYEISKQTSNVDEKFKPEMKPIEKTSVTANHDAALFDDKDIAPPFKEIEKQHEKEGSKRQNVELIKEGSINKIIQTKPTDIESLRQEHDNRVSSIFDEPKAEEATEKGLDNMARENKQLIKEGSIDKIIQTKPTDIESLRQEHDNKVSAILDELKAEEATEIGIDNMARENKKLIKRGSIDKILPTDIESLRQGHDNKVSLILDEPKAVEATELGIDNMARENKELIKEGSIDKIIQTKPTDIESLRQEHDNKVSSILDEPKAEEATEIGIDNMVTFKSAPNRELKNKDGTQSSGLLQSKNTSVISLAKDTNEQSINKLVAGSRLSSQSKMSKLHSRDSQIDAKNSKATPSPRGSNRSVKITPDENKASTQHITANVFPLHKATSSHSTDGNVLITSPTIKTSFTGSEKRILDETALAPEAETNIMSDGKIADTETPLAIEPQTNLPGSTTALHQETENKLISLLDGTSSLPSTTADKDLSTFVPLRSHSEDESIKIATEGSLVGSRTKGMDLELPYIRASFDKEVNTGSQSIFLQDPVGQELGRLDKFVREAESQPAHEEDNIIVAKKSSDISARDSKQSVNHKQGSTQLQKPIADKVGFEEKPLFETGYQIIEPTTATGIEDDTVTSKDGSRTSIDKTAQTENVILKDFTAKAESTKAVLRTGERPSHDSITSSLAPLIDIDPTDQFLVDIAFEFSRNGATKHTIIKSVDAESASDPLSKRNNIISHKSTTSNLLDQPIEIPINPKYNVSLKLNSKHKTSKEKRKTEKIHSRPSFVSFSGISPKRSNKVQIQSNIESNTRRKGMDINKVLETIYKEQLQPLEINMKKLKAEIQLLTQEQAYIQRSINNLTEKRSSLRANRMKRSLSCLCKKNTPNSLH